jgi:hypothetical protein
MIVAVIPCLDEADNVASVVAGLEPWVDRVIVVDNGSRDATAEVAAAAGADVVVEPRCGYGRACLAGIDRAQEHHPDVVLFLDGDGSDDPDDAPRLLEPVQSGEVDLCLGRRTARSTARGAMAPVQRFGNWFAPALMRMLFNAPYHDMPPFKAISARALEALDLRDESYGFTIEMLIKAHHRGLSVREVEVRHRARHAGQSKVSGTLVGSVRASSKILTAIARHALQEARN